MGVQWMKLYTSAARRWADSPDLPLVMRIWMLAIGRAKPGGHSAFDAGEIRKTLTKVNRRTGEVRSFTPQYLNDALRDGKAAGMFAPGSSLRCIVLPLNALEINLPLSAVPCPVHGHNKSWLHDRWVDTGDKNDRWSEDAYPTALAV